MPIQFKNTKFPNSPYSTVLIYNKNKVRIEEREGNQIIGFREFTYSKSNNLIKENYKVEQFLTVTTIKTKRYSQVNTEHIFLMKKN
jgi:hypothetical protein